LLIAIVVIFLMLAANFQSFKVSFVVLFNSTCRFARCLMLLVIKGSNAEFNNHTWAYMSVGVSMPKRSVVNHKSEQIRKHSGNALEEAKEATLTVAPYPY